MTLRSLPTPRMCTFHLTVAARAASRHIRPKSIRRYSSQKRQDTHSSLGALKVEVLTNKDIPNIYQLGLYKFRQLEKLCPEIYTNVPDIAQRYQKHINKLLQRDQVVGLIESAKNGKVTSFLIGRYVWPPSVYSAGLTCFVDEFHLNSNQAVPQVGSALFARLRAISQVNGATQFIVPRNFSINKTFASLLKNESLRPTSVWWVGNPLTSLKSQSISIRPIELRDLKQIVLLSEKKRKAYEIAEPLFWKMAPGANESQLNFLKDQLNWPEVIGLMAEDQGKIQGFVIGQLSKPEPFYTGKPLCSIDDFMVYEPALWEQVGGALLQQIYLQAQIIEPGSSLSVVAGYHDKPKSKFLENINLRQSTVWSTGPIIKGELI